MSTLENWSSVESASTRKQTSPLMYVLVLVSVLFIGILIFCYVVTKRANPVLVDVHGKPIAEGSASAHH